MQSLHIIQYNTMNIFYGGYLLKWPFHGIMVLTRARTHRYFQIKPENRYHFTQIQR